MKVITIAVFLAMLFPAATNAASDASTPAAKVATKARATAASHATATPAAAGAPAASKAGHTPEVSKPAAGATGGESKGETQAWWKALLVFLIGASKALGLPILLVLAIIANKKWKLGLEQKTVEWIVTGAVGYGEQKAKVALKAGRPMEGPAILKAGLEHGEALLIKKGMLGKWGDKLADMIEAKLGEQEAMKKDAAPKAAENQPKAES